MIDDGEQGSALRAGTASYPGLVHPSVSEPLTRLPDGTVKQRNPFTGTEVWTVPGRGHRPLGLVRPAPQPLDPAQHGRHCAFCEHRMLETPPEKSRIVSTRADDGAPAWQILRHPAAERLEETIPAFRRVPNLFEILSYDYWRLNHGYELPPDACRRRDEYLATEAGRAHVRAVVTAKLRASGRSAEEAAAMSEAELIGASAAFFGGTHDVVIARRHFVDGAVDDHQLASSGTLTPDEHHAFMALTADAMRDLYATTPAVRYVSVFQNWLKPAGASFDHLHKQLVAIDEVGAQNVAALDRLREDPQVFNQAALDVAVAHDLMIAANEHAVMFAGFGHRYPTVEVYSTSPVGQPWRQTAAELRAVSDLLHAAHAATGPDVPSNEEWHTRPPGVADPMPWRVMLKWRVSTLAGFEGATKINVNTLSPWDVRDRVLARLRELWAAGALADGMRIGADARVRPGMLRYAD
ncbi:DUF4921 family protein [Micrococcus luteus]|uniref:DUF4921 family protein n=1 Tax=Micrococcus luteus TaxID=1270 RepID=UPI00366E8A73